MNNRIVRQRMNFHRPMVMNIHYHIILSQHLRRNKQLKRKFAVVCSVFLIENLCFSHTKELLDEALDSVKNVLMQTFKKNLESGGDLT